MLLQLGLNRSSCMFLKPSIISKSSRSLLTSSASAPFKRYNSSAIKTTFKQEDELLIAQRKNRPVSPELTIYQPQIPWILSSVHRVSGVFLGLGFFTVTIAFGVSTLFGLGLNTENLKNYYKEKVPRWADWTMKGSAAYLFAFHFGNGIRHLVWDLGKEVTNPGVIKTGYAVLALTAIGGTALLFK